MSKQRNEKLYTLILVLGYSRAMYVEFTEDERHTAVFGNRKVPSFAAKQFYQYAATSKVYA
ncbi:hypothetical protein [Paenibacillus popilliae]|uniref:hypothetical protein n=1 Tax=Paenibacillus popilliae TaxID=78057 RepID=UPI0005AB8BB0|nr:hypothetical protein [Paenibacillus popilliae]